MWRLLKFTLINAEDAEKKLKWPQSQVQRDGNVYTCTQKLQPRQEAQLDLEHN